MSLSKTTSESVARETPKSVPDDTATRERRGAVMPESGEDDGTPAVTLRMWIATAVHEGKISLPSAVQLMRFVDAAERQDIGTAERVKNWCLRCKKAVTHLLGRR